METLLREWFREEHSGGRGEAVAITCDLEPPAHSPASQTLNRLRFLREDSKGPVEIKGKKKKG